jgi:hypothetical protein
VWKFGAQSSADNGTDYLPVYFQAVKLASPIQSGVNMLGLTLSITPAAMVCGISFLLFKKYMPQQYIGWIFMPAGCGILTVLNVNSSNAVVISSPILLGMGIGICWTMTKYPILAPLQYSNNAHALAFLAFVRSLSQVRVDNGF